MTSIPSSSHLHVPLGDVSVEEPGPSEHLLHVGTARNVPLGQIPGERGASSEHPVHICHVRNVPVGYVPVELAATSERAERVPSVSEWSVECGV